MQGAGDHGAAQESSAPPGLRLTSRGKDSSIYEHFPAVCYLLVYRLYEHHGTVKYSMMLHSIWSLNSLYWSIPTHEYVRESKVGLSAEGNTR